MIKITGEIFKVVRPVVLYIKAPSQDAADAIGSGAIEEILLDAVRANKLKPENLLNTFVEGVYVETPNVRSIGKEREND